MERSSSPDQDPEQKDSPEAPRRPPGFDDVTMIRDLNQGVLSIADAAHAGSTPLAETQPGSTAGAQAAEADGPPAPTTATAPVGSPPASNLLNAFVAIHHDALGQTTPREKSLWGREKRERRRAGLLCILLLSGRPWSILKGTLVGSSISSGRTTS